jgi:hypothetical protein
MDTGGKEMKRYIWVVEMKEGEQYMPTVGVGLWKRIMKAIKEDWQYRNPGDKFRIRKYIPEDEIGNYIVPTDWRR